MSARSKPCTHGNFNACTVSEYCASRFWLWLGGGGVIAVTEKSCIFVGE